MCVGVLVMVWRCQSFTLASDVNTRCGWSFTSDKWSGYSIQAYSSFRNSNSLEQRWDQSIQPLTKSSTWTGSNLLNWSALLHSAAAPCFSPLEIPLLLSHIDKSLYFISDLFITEGLGALSPSLSFLDVFAENGFMIMIIVTSLSAQQSLNVDL